MLLMLIIELQAFVADALCKILTQIKQIQLHVSVPVLASRLVF